MELKGEQKLAADRPTAWAMLNDIEVLKLCVPGCESISASGNNSYDILMTAAVGPVKARFKGKLVLADIDAPRRYTLKFDGQSGQAGFARGQAQVELHELSPSETKLVYLANAQVGGKLAQVGSRLIDAAAGATADKFFKAFAAQLAARTAPAGASVHSARRHKEAVMLVRSWRFVTLLLVALLTGLAFAHVLERPAKMLYDAAFYVTVQKTLYVAWGPPNIGGFLEPAAILATIALAFGVRKRRRAFWLSLGAGVALLLAFPVAFFVFVAPANEVFLAATSTNIPSNWMALRASWETGHAIRFVLQLGALSLLVLSVLYETRTDTSQSA